MINFNENSVSSFRIRPIALIDIGLVMSNYDYHVDLEVKEELIKGRSFAQHAATNFCGYVWFDNGIFYEEVWINKEHVDTLSDELLENLVCKVNDKYGWK